MNVRRLLALLVVVFACVHAPAQIDVIGDGGPGPVKAQHLTAELVSLAPAVAPGGSVHIGLVMSLEEKWHVYWINAGDSGEPPAIKWTLPAGVTAGPLLFPVPTRLPLGPLMDFGYEETTAFPLQISVAPNTPPGPIHLDAIVTWLVCREVCIPGKAHMGINLTVAPGAAPEQALGELGEALKAVPEPLPSEYKFSVNGGRTEFVLTVTGTPQDSPKVTPDDVELYPFDPDLIVNAGDQKFERIANGFRLRVPRSPDLTTLPPALHGVLKFTDGEGYEVSAPIVPGEVAAAPKSSIRAKGSSTLTALPALGLAFLGGIILNLMPCVFPVLFLKGLALVQSSVEERKTIRAHGFVYTLGILVSFWIIVAILLTLRAEGSRIGWGFQLQNPAFIAILAAFLFFFALSLAGQFDLGLSLTSAGGELAKKEGYTGSFFTGVLATIVATPCTAPLMGAAIGYALAQPPAITFAVFTALALGLALPYLVLTLEPSWTRILPRPGAWMETLKELTAVPLFATVVWLAWVYGRLHVGAESDHMGYLLLCFLVLAIAGWVLHRWPAKTPASLVAALLVIAALAIPLSQTRKYTPPTVASAASQSTSQANLSWQPYSQATLDAARAAGHPVFIDFTAAWCLSCQVNEKLILHAPEVEQQLAAHSFTLLRADWTNEDPAITSELASLNRSGVPTYVIYPAQGSPDVLPELLTKPIVLKAITADAK
jgi:thiol:disulfide interchange protein/DsbC/DsbD-like thiol-disulfide interchange protein